MARKRRHLESHEEEHIDESWLIPYADLLTLLLALFIVLFSMRSEDSAKANAVLESLYNAFNTVSVFETNSGGQSPTTNSTKNSDSLKQLEQKEQPQQQETPQTTNAEEQQLQQLMRNLQVYIDKNKLNAEITLTDKSEGIQITLKDRIIFDSGSDHLKDNFLPILDDIVGMIKTVDRSITIEGHTDNKPIHSAKFPSNWELSGARALSVLHYFEKQKIAPTRLQFVGFGDSKPIVSNDTPEHREANRRVNIIILRNK
ncbi:OmpA family protein [Bacillus sp. ISL-18]|uniref:OmpA family protein n=1 Tax=Bacillus sp. ISL-18 TaxID=2819118 RepID=UPI001BECF7BE|nr:OmpA family protein [Bacillus sp. ISL-18]MBT2657802.1 OmpA family protein [Bacillus sp. ISL-18]